MSLAGAGLVSTDSSWSGNGWYKLGSEATVTFTLKEGYTPDGIDAYEYQNGGAGTKLNLGEPTYDAASNTYTYTISNIQDDVSIRLVTKAAE